MNNRMQFGSAVFRDGREQVRAHNYYSKVAGRWNLVTQCRECKQFVRDLPSEGKFSRQTWPATSGNERTPAGFSVDFGHSSCSACKNPPRSLVDQCEICGVFGSPRFVQPRERTRAVSDSGMYIYKNGRTLTCPRCVRKAIRYTELFVALNAERRGLARLNRDLKQAIKEEAQHG